MSLLLSRKIVFSQAYELIEMLSAFAPGGKIFAPTGLSLHAHTVTAGTVDHNSRRTEVSDY